MQQPQVPVLSIRLVPAGVGLVLAGLNQLPRGQVDGLYREIEAQANAQLALYEEAAKRQKPADATDPKGNPEEPRGEPMPAPEDHPAESAGLSD